MSAPRSLPTPDWKVGSRLASGKIKCPLNWNIAGHFRVLWPWPRPGSDRGLGLEQVCRPCGFHSQRPKNQDHRRASIGSEGQGQKVDERRGTQAGGRAPGNPGVGCVGRGWRWPHGNRHLLLPARDPPCSQPTFTSPGSRAALPGDQLSRGQE